MKVRDLIEELSHLDQDQLIALVTSSMYAALDIEISNENCIVSVRRNTVVRNIAVHRDDCTKVYILGHESPFSVSETDRIEK
jgi:hypothetical protein